MCTMNGEKYLIVDAHVALWDARPGYLHQRGERLMRDLFTDGYVDHAIFQPAYLHEFHETGFGQSEEASALAKTHPDSLTYNHFDPRNGEAGLERLQADTERFGLEGVRLYTAAWHGDSRAPPEEDVTESRGPLRGARAR